MATDEAEGTADPTSHADLLIVSGEADLRELLEKLYPKARDDHCRVLIHGQADRDGISSRLMRYRDQNGQDWGRHHRPTDDVSGCATTGGSDARRD
jgi:hypothetical protein